MASSAGVEPTTSPLGGVHSIQLSYEDLKLFTAVQYKSFQTKQNKKNKINQPYSYLVT